MNHFDLSRAQWRKGSRSGGNGACVEVAGLQDVIAVRDSKASTRSILLLAPAQWRALLSDVRAGHHDLA